ncbi:uncharacterized protein KQ657_004867 [Scheffersomyces spartinae]|uniref:Uncharacterized protein n=1 Tax=Scheffersomyces spartinae TaxID=45513 RepID=A0A9P8AIT8_9ASCO|nr:uncharacterized protein KQ657_004867 [Scheffersomyces spartinae]KAG7194159.1 hypothetical protein KQ657_004867 [Scheffersomyces spartinae]
MGDQTKVKDNIRKLGYRKIDKLNDEKYVEINYLGKEMYPKSSVLVYQNIKNYRSCDQIPKRMDPKT